MIIVIDRRGRQCSQPVASRQSCFPLLPSLSFLHLFSAQSCPRQTATMALEHAVRPVRLRAMERAAVGHQVGDVVARHGAGERCAVGGFVCIAFSFDPPVI